ncbi:hypothetical protein BKA80DRAFT_263326 [Phyllosticta citrichinensis]
MWKSPPICSLRDTCTPIHRATRHGRPIGQWIKGSKDEGKTLRMMNGIEGMCQDAPGKKTSIDLNESDSDTQHQFPERCIDHERSRAVVHLLDPEMVAFAALLSTSMPLRPRCRLLRSNSTPLWLGSMTTRMLSSAQGAHEPGRVLRGKLLPARLGRHRYPNSRSRYRHLRLGLGDAPLGFPFAFPCVHLEPRYWHRRRCLRGLR